MDKNLKDILASNRRQHPYQKVTRNLESMKNKLINNLCKVKIDHFRIQTGSNIGEYVVPEDRVHGSLRIRDGDKILETSNKKIIDKLVEQGSSSFKGTIAEITHLKQIYKNWMKKTTDFEKGFMIISISKKVFAVSEILEKYINQYNRNIIIEYEADMSYKGIEAIAISPAQKEKQENARIYMFDTLKDNMISSEVMKKIIYYLDQGCGIFFSPQVMAEEIYEANYSMKLGKYKVINDDKIASRNCNEKDLLIKNPTPNKSILKIETLDYLTV